MYEFPLCPFCIKVRRQLHRLNLPMTIFNAKEDPFRQELLEGGGKVKVPCLRIENQDGQKTWMYESSDINAFLTKEFA